MGLLPQQEPSLCPKPRTPGGVLPPARVTWTGPAPVPSWTSEKSTVGGLTASLSPSEQRSEVADAGWEKRAGGKGCASLLLTALIQGGNS